MIFQRSFKEVSRKDLKCLIEFKALVRVFQCCYDFKVAYHSSQLPEQKEGLFIRCSSLTL